MASNGDREISSAAAANLSFKHAEYEALRQEILTRNEFRQRTVELTLLSPGAILAAGLKIEDLGPLLLLYPVAVFFLAASWGHNGVGVLLAGSHIREQFEGSSHRGGWESTWRSHPLARPFSILVVLSSSGVFLTGQLLTWGLVGRTQFQHRPGDWVLAAAGGPAIVATFVLMRYYARLQ
jgi:hypothetical protein